MNIMKIQDLKIKALCLSNQLHKFTFEGGKGQNCVLFVLHTHRKVKR